MNQGTKCVLLRKKRRWKISRYCPFNIKFSPVYCSVSICPNATEFSSLFSNLCPSLKPSLCPSLKPSLCPSLKPSLCPSQSIFMSLSFFCVLCLPPGSFPEYLFSAVSTSASVFPPEFLLLDPSLFTFLHSSLSTCFSLYVSCPMSFSWVRWCFPFRILISFSPCADVQYNMSSFRFSSMFYIWSSVHSSCDFPRALSLACTSVRLLPPGSSAGPPWECPRRFSLWPLTTVWGLEIYYRLG